MKAQHCFFQFLKLKSYTMEISELKILLIEDNPNDAELTMRAFKKSNFLNKIIHLKDGSEALDYLFYEGIYKDRERNDNPAVILLDLKMPKVNGIEVLRKIKSDPSTRSIPVVVLTSSNEDPDVAACYELGVNSYIVKPVGFDNFANAVSQLGMYWLMLNQRPT